MDDLKIAESCKDEDVGNAVAALDLSRVAKAFINIRDARTALAEKFKADDAALKTKLTTLEGVMLRHLNSQNANSISTDNGTVYRQEELTPTGSDWDALYKWIRDNDAFDALERRIKKNFIKAYMDDNDGAIPPGVSIFKEFVVRVRRT